ncbi:MAG: hypothetical protein AAFQ43_06260, partial [Bacteroidota bacterium]
NSAHVVTDQLARSCTRSGLLEVNDFSNPAAPRLALVEWSEGRTLDIAALLADSRGRVLLYDRDRNRAVAAARSGAHVNPLDAVAEAERLAAARRHNSDRLQAPPGSTPLLAEAVERELRERHDGCALEAPDPHASGLAALVAELQGSPLSAPLEDSSDDHASAPPPPPEDSAWCLSTEIQAENAPVSLAPSSASPATHPLAKPLDALRTEVYALFEDAVGQDRALTHDAHITEEAGWPTPVSATHVPSYLRALLVADPPRRWHFFKRSRQKCFEAVSSRLLAFHGAHGHDARDGARECVNEIAQLWARIHR